MDVIIRIISPLSNYFTLMWLKSITANSWTRQYMEFYGTILKCFKFNWLVPFKWLIDGGQDRLTNGRTLASLWVYRTFLLWIPMLWITVVSWAVSKKFHNDHAGAKEWCICLVVDYTILYVRDWQSCNSWLLDIVITDILMYGIHKTVYRHELETLPLHLRQSTTKRWRIKCFERNI